jgi:hypothetical protein
MAVESSGTEISSNYVRSLLMQEDTKYHTEQDDPQDREMTNRVGKKSYILTSVCTIREDTDFTSVERR